MCIIVDLKVKFLVVKGTLTRKDSFLIVSHWRRNETHSRNQSPENSKVTFRESESLKENVNRYLRTFYLSHHELLMIEFRRVLNEKCTECQKNDCNQCGHELCLSASIQEQVNNYFEEAYNRVKWDQVFHLCHEKLRNTDSHDLCPFLPMASDEMGMQEVRYKKIMKDIPVSRNSNRVTLS